METRGAIDAQTIIIKNANKAFAAERKKRAPAEKRRWALKYVVALFRRLIEIF